MITVQNNQRLLVITPTLGDSPFLDETVASVRRLGLAISHVLCCPAERIGALRARFPGCRITSDAGRLGGLYGALNAALEAFSREAWRWFTYINDDDVLPPSFAAMFQAHTGRTNPEPVTYGKVRLINERSQTLSWITNETTPRYLPAILQNGMSPLNQQGMLFHREVLERLNEFDQRYRLCADLDFWVRAYTEGFCFRYYPIEVGQFRLRRGQLSGNVLLTQREQEDIVRRHFPKRSPGWLLLLLRIRYRLCNATRYLERLRSVGWKKSCDVLGGASQ
jgi:GT2 family glycosyltransferase